MFELKILISIIFWAQLINGNQYGSRMRTEALANSDIDGRIAAILNTGTEVPQLIYHKYDTMGTNNIKLTPDVKPQTITKKYGEGSPQENKNEMPIIEVNASDMPVGIIFRTNSPKVNVEQHHISDPVPKIESTRTEEEPHRLIHEVYRPVIQELTEVIQPYRKVVQQIQPVIEEVQQIISSSQQPRAQSSQSSQSSQSGAQMLMTAANQNPTMATLSNSGSYQSSSNNQVRIYQNEIPKNLITSEGAKWLKSTPRSNVNKATRSTTKIQPRFQSYFIQGQNMVQNQQNFQNRYISYGGALSGLKNDQVHRMGIISPQADSMHTLRSKTNGNDYELYEVKIGTGSAIKGGNSLTRYS